MIHRSAHSTVHDLLWLLTSFTHTASSGYTVWTLALLLPNALEDFNAETLVCVVAAGGMTVRRPSNGFATTRVTKARSQ